MNAWSARINVPVKVESCADEACEGEPIEEAYFYIDFECFQMEDNVELTVDSQTRNGDMDANLFVEF